MRMGQRKRDISKMSALKTSSICMAALLSVSAASAAEFEVKMVNAGSGGMMQFEPELLKITPGDSVRFVAVDKGHNAQSVDGMIPPGAKPFAGPIGGDLEVTLTVPGVYGYRCSPHGTLGMVGLIVVGPPLNESTAKSAAMSGAAGRVFAKLFQNLDSTRTAEK